jgi:hypothetical protein
MPAALAIGSTVFSFQAIKHITARNCGMHMMWFEAKV